MRIPVILLDISHVHRVSDGTVTKQVPDRRIWRIIKYTCTCIRRKYVKVIGGRDRIPEHI